MENSKLVVKLEFKGKEELQQLIAQIGKKYDIPVDIDLSTAKLGVFKEFENRFQKLSQTVVGFSTHMGFAIQGIKQMYSVLQKAIGPFIKTSSEFEQLRLRLFNLYQDTDRATAAFEKFRKVALETPATLREVVEAGANLKAFGLDAEDVLESVQDLAAFMGINVVEAANAVGRAFAGGAGAAMMLRDRGILELIRSFNGIDDLSKLTLPEFREAMLSTFKSTETGIAGSSARMADSYAGAMAQMQDAMETLYAVVGDHFTPAIAGAARVLTRFVEKLAGAKSGAEAVKASLTSQRVEFERLVMVYKDLHHNQSRSTEDNIKYQKTINDLMNKYPNYFKKIDLEKGAWKDISKAIDSARVSLQEWINIKIKEAFIEEKKDEMVKLVKKESDATFELETLLAEFEAGTKSRTMQVVAAPDPLSPHYRADRPRYVSKESWDSKREKKLQANIAKYQSDLNEINEEIARRVAMIAGVEVEEPGGGGGGSKSGVTGSTEFPQAEIDSIMREIEAYRVLREANYNEELAQIETLKQEYSLKLKAVAGNADAERDLVEKRDREIAEIENNMKEQNEKDEAAHYDKLKFYAEGYYDWKAGRIREEAERSGSPQSWVDDQMAQLEREQEEWDRRAVLAFEDQYDAEMTHLGRLRDLGLATYSEVADKSWEYYRSLKAILEADGELSEEEKELLAIYQKRAQGAQLAVNRESDLARYYNEIKFLDEGYYDWKKARIEEDVRTMDLSEEQKVELVKARLDELRKEFEGFQGDQTLFGRIMESIGISDSQQGKVVGAFQSMANQISGIFSQMYNKLGSERDKALADLEKRAKSERKTDAWLAKEKERINEEYEKKQRDMKRAEQKMQLASATVNTLEGITNALTIKPAWLAPIMAAAVGALGFAQVKLIAEQKFATGGLFRGKGSSTSDSNIIAVSDHEYIVSADRVKRFGVGFFDALNFGGAEQIRKALSGFQMPVLAPVAVAPRTGGFSTGGHVGAASERVRDVQMNVVLKCDGKELARAVARGNKKIIST